MARAGLIRLFWIGAAALLTAAALIAIAAVVRGDFSDSDGRILGTLAAALLTGSTLLAGLLLVERGGRILGWTAVALALPAFVLLAYAIWDVVFDGGGDAWRYGWTGTLTLVASLLAVTARLLARAAVVRRLATGAGVLAAAAAAVSTVAVWQRNPGDAIGKTLAVLWILTGASYLLVPILQRFNGLSAPASASDERVLGALHGVELVASRGAVDGVPVARPDPGERLILRPIGAAARPRTGRSRPRPPR